MIIIIVIVIAVIAILAAVLIPTFSNVVEKANNSALAQQARNEYTEYLAAVDYTTDEAILDGYVQVTKGEETYTFEIAGGSFKATPVTATVDPAKQTTVVKTPAVESNPCSKAEDPSHTTHDSACGYVEAKDAVKYSVFAK